MQFATAKHPELPDVPLVTDLARSEQVRAALDLILTQQVMGRPFATPPKVPAERLAALRRHSCKRSRTRSSSPRPTSSRSKSISSTAQTLQAMVERMFKAPKDVVEAARKAIGQR